MISVAFGEGYHNYHHVFPWDYRAAEIGTIKTNQTKVLIDMFAKIGNLFGWKYV